MAFDVISQEGSKQFVLRLFEQLFNKTFDATELSSNVVSNAIPSGITPIPSGITPLSREELLKKTTTPPAKP